MKKKLIIILILSIAASVCGYVLQNSYKFKLCFADASTNTYDVSCHTLLMRLGDPLFYGMTVLSVVFLALIFIPSAFNAWRKFAIWSVPLMAIIFTFYKGPQGGFMDPTPYPKQVFLWLSIFYAIVSLGIIFYSWHKNKKISKE